MSEFQVDPGAVEAAAKRLSVASTLVTHTQATVSATKLACNGTLAQGAFDDMLAHWEAVLPHYLESVQSLTDAMTAAGQGYAATDRAVQTSAEVR